jgi:predicted esterase
MAGEPLSRAKAGVLLLHGRGASPEDILSLSAELELPGLAFLAPRAEGGQWYPYSFLEPLERNEAGIRRGFRVMDALLATLEGSGIDAQRVFLGGFSQGACLALEYAASHARRYGGVFGLSGGLIGPDGTPRNYEGSLAGTPVFIGCSDVDPYIPKGRVEESARVMERLGASVTLRLYPGAPHSVNEEEITEMEEILRSAMS